MDTVALLFLHTYHNLINKTNSMDILHTYEANLSSHTCQTHQTVDAPYLTINLQKQHRRFELIRSLYNFICMNIILIRP